MSKRNSELSNEFMKENSFNNFLSEFPHPTMVLNLDGIVLNCNTRLLELYNIKQFELLNKNIFEVCGSNQITPPFPTVEDACNIKNRTSIVKKNQNLNQTKTIQWSASTIPMNKNETGVFIIGFDVSTFINASKQEKNIKNSIIDHIPNHYIFWKDKESVYLGCNAALASTVGLSSSTEIIGKTDYDLPTTKEQSDAYRADDRFVMESKKPKLNIEEYQTLPNGEVRILSTSKTPLLDENGQVYGVLAIYSDITERKNMELSLEKAKNQAEAANRAKTEFIANMSHDIRTPLSGVVGMAQLLEESVVQPEQKQFARWIYDCGQQLLSMLNGILDVVSAENVSEDNIHKETFNLYQCVKDIVQIERPTTILKNIDLKVSIDQEVPEYIVSDRTKIHRILLNLLGNAIKFTEKGHVGITINVISHKKKQMLRFRITDTGIGIPPEHQDKVFDRFFRASPSYKGIYTGHGIGLHIAQSYVKQLDGEIKLTSKEGTGTTFSFDLPLKLPTKKEIEDCIESMPAVPNIPEPSLNAKITPTYKDGEEVPYLLLVEDNPVALKVLESIAEKMECHFISAANGEDALELATANPFDLIITDIGLPKISGYELSKQFRHWEKTHRKEPIPIIGLTAHGEKKAKNECIASGMSDVYTKPIDLNVLKEILKKFFNNSSKNSGLREAGALDTELPTTEQALFELTTFPLFDLENAVEKTGSKTMTQEILTLMSSEEIPTDLDALQKAYAENNWTDIEKLAHKIKGGAIYCGTVRLKYACQYLERYQKAGHTKELKKLYKQLIKVLQETKEHIEAWLTNSSAQ